MIVEVLRPSVLYETKDGMYGEDGSETFDEYIAKLNGNSSNDKPLTPSSSSTFSN